jgi:hypothetical protein
MEEVNYGCGSGSASGGCGYGCGYGYGDGDGSGYGEGFEIYPLTTDDPLVALQHVSP